MNIMFGLFCKLSNVSMKDVMVVYIKYCYIVC